MLRLKEIDRDLKVSEAPGLRRQIQALAYQLQGAVPCRRPDLGQDCRPVETERAVVDD